MKVLLCTLLVLPVFCQTLPPAVDPQNGTPLSAVADPPPDAPQTAPTDQGKNDQGQKPNQQAQRSVLEIKPGGEALKNKDLYEATGYFHPFVRMPKYVLLDQKAIWTSPIHTARRDIKWCLIFGAATGGLIALDKHIEHALPNSSTQTHLGADFSNIGAAYTLIPLSASFYFFGTAAGSDHFRETGLLSFEALIDTTIIETLLKGATHRARPTEGNGKGGFWDSSASWSNSSFPSGHTINTFAIASIFAHEYHHKRWPVYVAYGLAGVVSAARLAGRDHFPSDIVAGGAMGWFVGDYVYGKRHNPDLDKKQPVARRLLEHIHFGMAAGY